jgi:hypothetical protein
LSVATVAHVRDDPAAWRGDVWGYGLRVASGTGGTLAFVGAEHRLAAALRVDLRYVPRRRGSVGRRLAHAFWEGATVRTRGGRRLPNVPLAGGRVVATLAQRRWEGNASSAGDLGRSLVAALVAEGLYNAVAREFR